jgi:NRAMP (natural resistance-associated macrophage protein)-like metal ion transporter
VVRNHAVLVLVALLNQSPPNCKLKKNKLRNLWNQLGPGLITGSSDDDPSGITTYSQAGAKFGLDTLWTALFSWPLMVSIQHMCAKIGLVTKLGLAGNIKKHYPKPVIWAILIFCIPAILLNIGANISAMSGVILMLFPKMNPFLFSTSIVIAIYLTMVRFSYHKMTSLLKYVCLILFVYAIIPFIIHADFKRIVTSTFLPKFTNSSDFAGMLIAIFGTTLSPYLFFWQSNMEAEETHSIKKRKFGVRRLFFNEKKDVLIGMGFSNLIMFFIILTTGTVLHQSGNTNIGTLEDAALALKPLAGKEAYLLFAIGIIGTGLLSLPILTGTISYMICETMDWNMGMNKKYKEAKSFYHLIGASLLGGIAFQILQINPIESLTYAAFGYGLIAPVVIVLIIQISNNKKWMGNHANGLLVNVLGWISVAVMLSCVLFYFLFGF